jgi:DNA-binding response OmpR family regulator
VLLLEDNIDAADSLSRVLQISGHLVEVAHGLAATRKMTLQRAETTPRLPGFSKTTSRC